MIIEYFENEKMEKERIENKLKNEKWKNKRIENGNKLLRK